MGNLGWDTEGSVLLDRATQIISDIGMSDKVIEMRAAVSKQGTGSCVDIMWTNTADIQEAKFKVRCKNIIWTGRQVWVGRKKSREEMKLARMIHKTAEIMEAFEWDRPDGGRIEKNVANKYMNLNGVRMFYTLRGTLMNTVHAALRYTSDELEQIRAFAEE